MEEKLNVEVEGWLQKQQTKRENDETCKPALATSQDGELQERRQRLVKRSKMMTLQRLKEWRKLIAT